MEMGGRWGGEASGGDAGEGLLPSVFSSLPCLSSITTTWILAWHPQWRKFKGCLHGQRDEGTDM